jgi:gamma-glutamyltranspeptidase/glutathione hydrolase
MNRSISRWLKVQRFLVVLLAASVLSAQDTENAAPPNSTQRQTTRQQGRSLVISRYGMVATSQTLASQAGAQVLEAGGNAIDAAIAANAVMGVVEPESDGLGGDLFAIYYEAKTKKLYGLNASGWAPSHLTIEALEARGIAKMPNDGINSISVPGMVAGWEALRTRFGTMPYSKLLASAITYAQDGFPVTEWISEDWERNAKKLARDPFTRATYLPEGHPLQVGEMFRNTDLANSLRLIAASGPDAYYKGPIAAAIVKRSKELDGPFEAVDFTDYRPEWVEPITTTYRGWTVAELPPNGVGIAVLSMLNIMERFPLESYGAGSARAMHVMIEAKKLAYADMIRRVGDPAFSTIPVAQLLSKEYAAKRADLINPERAACSVLPSELAGLTRLANSDTIYLTVVDHQGNQVSFIQSNFGLFGSGLVAPGTGFILQNRAGLFTLEAGHPNALMPHKRPMHTLVPGFMIKGDTHVTFGFIGGFNQAQAGAQFVANIADFGMNVQKALEFPRFTKGSFEGCDVTLESPVAPTVLEELRRLGHEVRLVPPLSSSVGGGQAILHNDAGVNFGGSDPRKDGAAIPEPPHVFPILSKEGVQ